MKEIAKNKFNSLLFFSFFSTFLCGCLALPSMQTGRTLGKNNFEIGGNITSGKYSSFSVPSIDSMFDYAPIIGLSFLGGVSDKLDIGVSLTYTSFIIGNVKYQFLGTNKTIFAASIGGNLGTNLGSSLVGNFAYFASTPLYLSYHPAPKVSFYFTPRFTYSYEYIYVEPYKGQRAIQNSYNTISTTYGILLGSKNRFAIEVSNFGTYRKYPTHLTIGYMYVFHSKPFSRHD